jgi:hypothetical protein
MSGELELHSFLTIAIDDMGVGLHAPAVLTSHEHLPLSPPFSSSRARFRAKAAVAGF